MTSAVGESTGVFGSRDEEFSEFMGQAMAGLTRTAWHLTGDEHRAADLVQQTLVRTYLAWSRARTAPLPFARKVMANQRITTWRSRRREVLAAPQGLPDTVDPDGSSAVAERDRLVRALACLGAQQRRVVVLRYVEGFSEKEVAQMLGVSVGTVKSAGSRGLLRLRQTLEAEEGR
ncbi:MAG: SigE family RNA polymerase sigma factor [Micrococcales bacterium]|nr:SigE family RNA polymerase sigma factor [Micrococcales bacterium]MCL2668384.1 SigE family RNA polymerase sigma factor [Micrococcales bacterium]